MTSSISAGLALFSSILMPFHATDNAVISPTTPIPVAQQWECDTAKWVESLSYSGSRLTGAMATECWLIGQNGGGFPNLRSDLESGIELEAAQIYSGPTNTTYNKVNATHYDVKMDVTSNGTRLISRQDIYVGTDDTTVFYFDSFSQWVQGSGDAKYIKRIDILADIVPDATTSGKYIAKIKMRVGLDKPFLIPGGMFKSKVKTAIEGEAASAQEDLVTLMMNSL